MKYRETMKEKPSTGGVPGIAGLFLSMIKDRRAARRGVGLVHLFFPMLVIGLRDQGDHPTGVRNAHLGLRHCAALSHTDVRRTAVPQ